eukprot:SAG11_NODE_27219_length_335_cov_0.868644_1_plen_39_part_10
MRRRGEVGRSRQSIKARLLVEHTHASSDGSAIPTASEPR